MSPIEKMMADVEWVAATGPIDGSGLPYATHSGVLNLLGHELRCYRLNDGRSIIHAEDLQNFFGSGITSATKEKP